MRTPSVSLLLPGALLLAACSAERAEPARRDLTLLPTAQSATPAVASARELDLPRGEPGATDASAALARVPAPARTRAHPARLTEEANALAPAPAPDAEPAPTPPAPEPEDVAVAATGAGQPLEPGQTVTVMPATSGTGPARVPGTDVATERGIRARPWVIIGGDRCIPGRGEVIPRGPHGLRGRR